MFLVGIAALAAVQLVQPKVSYSAGANKHDLLEDQTLDPQVRAIFKRSCADCHSNEVKLPWYAHVSPISWLILRHIDQGRDKLNFSNWPRNSVNLKQEIADSVIKHEMPLSSYTWIHSDARLKSLDLEAIDRWATAR